MTGLLASVATLDEMEVARAGGADVVDLKNPSEGALGAWDLAALRHAVALWRGWPEPRPLLSATIGDHAMAPWTVLDAAEGVAATGVPIVKLGLFPDGDVLACISALSPLAARTRLVAVLFADRAPDFSQLPALAAAGFHGAMLDTADKTRGGLRSHLGADALARFVAEARDLSLLTGLAGSLALADVPPLAALAPDFLGFRGALCFGGRTGPLDAEPVARIRDALAKRRRAA